MVVHKNKDPYDVYIGRPSQWGNPVRVGYPCPECGQVHQKGGFTLKCYRKYLMRRLKEEEFRAQLLQLRGLTLACWCAPQGGLTIHDPEICHGQVMLKAIEWLHSGGIPS